MLAKVAKTHFVVLEKKIIIILPLTEATWEETKEFSWRFPHFNLEDKVEATEEVLSRIEKGNKRKITRRK